VSAGTITVVIPSRNPTEVMRESISALEAQRNRDFSVLISDNHSSSGREYLDEAETRLKAAGIAVQRIQPPAELGRVEHWNWAMHQVATDWIKPLFLGDALYPEYFERVCTALETHPSCGFVFSSYRLAMPGESEQETRVYWSGFTTAEKMREVTLKYGMQFGPPSGVMFRRDLFDALGGFPLGLPICADSFLFCRMAATGGAFGVVEPLFRFHIHATRFSSSLPEKRWNTLRETILYRGALAYHAWTQGQPAYWGYFLKAVTATWWGTIKAR